jgi:nucleoside-diphosphate-sugar epimerase
VNVLVAGAGYVGAVLAAELAARGDRVHALRRHAAAPPPGCTALTLDCSDARALEALPRDLDAAALLLAPDTPDDAGYERAYVTATRNLVRALAPRAPRLVFASSTAVYAQRHGEWVDEESPAEPTDFRGRRLLEGEAAAREARGEVVVLRLGGIYGPGRTALLARLATGAGGDPGAAPHYANRIHRDDAAGAIAHLLRLPRPAPCYLGVDCEPADERAVRAWLAAQPPARLRALRGRAPGAAPRRRPGSKRCSNARLLASGYRFRYPTFREGYGALLDGVT